MATQRHTLAVLAERTRPLHQICGRHGHILAHADALWCRPTIVARLGSVIADAGEAGPGYLWKAHFGQ